MNWLLFAALTTTATIAYTAGLALGSALCNRRWAEKCARCQALYDRCSPGIRISRVPR